MSNSLHRAAFHYPMPLVRKGSTIQRDRLYGGYSLATDFGEDIGKRIVFFGPDLDDLLSRLGEAGYVREDEYGWVCD